MSGQHADRRWPKAESSYSCKACQSGQHHRCQREVQIGPSDREACECFMATPQVHEHVAPKTLTTHEQLNAEFNSVHGTDPMHWGLAKLLAEDGYKLITPGIPPK